MEGEKKKILIVDDDGFLLDMYAFKFSQSGFEVYTAIGGELALEKLKGGLRPDIILMDIIMPEMDGFEMLDKINTEKLAENSVKIILSNKNQQEDINRGTSMGVAGYIVKANSTPAEVISQVSNILLGKHNQVQTASVPVSAPAPVITPDIVSAPAVPAQIQTNNGS